MGLLGEIIETPRGKKHFFVITDRLTNLVRVISIKTTRVIDIGRAFLPDSVFVYGASITVLTEDGPQFTARFLLEAHLVFGTQ